LPATTPRRSWLDRADHIAALLDGAGTLDNEARVCHVSDGLGTPTAVAGIDIAARVVVDLVIDLDSGALRSLATVSRFEPLDLDARD
jgi:hypothetical protein